MRESGGHLLVGMWQIRLRYWRRELRSWGYLWHLDLGRPWHAARHHRGLLWNVALWSLVALGWEAVLLMWLQLTGERLRVLGRDTRLMRQVSMWVSLLALKRSRRPRSRRVSLRQRLPHGLRELLLLLLLWLRCRRSSRALNGHPWLGHERGIGPHLRSHGVTC